MAWIYFPESEASPSPSRRGSGRSATWKWTGIPRPCSCPACREMNVPTTPNIREGMSEEEKEAERARATRLRNARLGMTCELSTPAPGLEAWISSQADSPARTSARRAAERAWRDSEASFFGRSSGVLASYDPASSSWRTSQLSLDGEAEKWQGPLPRWGLMLAGVCYRLSMWERRTSGSGGGVWPTIRTTDGDRGGRGDLIQAVRGNENAHYRLWPAPQAHDARGGSANRVGRFGTEHGGRNLADEVLLPTPRSTSGGGNRSANPGAPYRPALAQAVLLPSPTASRRTGLQSHGVNVVTGQLNPAWVEWLMGFPLGWTVLRASEMRWLRSARAKRSGG